MEPVKYSHQLCRRGTFPEEQQSKKAWYFGDGVLFPLVRRHCRVSPFHPCISSVSVLTQQGKLFFSPALRPPRERAPPGRNTCNPPPCFPWGPQVVTIPWRQQHHRAPRALRGQTSARRCLWLVLPALRSSAALRLPPRDHLLVITSLSSSESHIPAPLDLRGITPGRNWPIRPTTLTASARK